MMAKSLLKKGVGVLLVTVGGLFGLLSVAQAGVEVPSLPPAKVAGKCVEDTDFMRRNHMDLLKHHRNDTMRLGIRTTKHSLKGCVECHASEKSGSVANSKDDFCVACHSYASVKLDCWGCHATKPGKKPADHPAAALGATRAGGEK
jgi:hypothetical protein